MVYYCHQCKKTVNAEADQTLRCSICKGEFIEEVPPSSNYSEVDEEGPESLEIGDFLRIISNTLNQRNPPTTSNTSPGSSHGSSNSGAASSSRGFFGQLLSNIMQSTPTSSSSQAPNQPSDETNTPGEQNMMDFMNQLIANLSANAGNGTVHVQFGSGPPIHGNINNYVFGDGAFDQIMSQLLNHAEVQHQGLSKEDLERLQKTKIVQEQIERELQCTTCMENFKLDEDVIQLPCRHIFHQDCIFPWLSKQRTCPICRTELEKTKLPDITDVDELD